MRRVRIELAVVAVILVGRVHAMLSLNDGLGLCRVEHEEPLIEQSAGGVVIEDEMQ
jgi:hypothetical protein